jgi:DASH complex subunit DAD2
MAQPTRSFTTNPNTGTIPNTSRSSLIQNPHGPSSALHARIAQKRQELHNLTQLRDLSAELTAQLETLQARLGQLKDGAQSVGLVLANWENVLGVIRMVGTKAPVPMPMSMPMPMPASSPEDDIDRGEEENGHGATDREQNRHDQQQRQRQPQLELPVPLVRIPVQSKPGVGG